MPGDPDGSTLAFLKNFYTLLLVLSLFLGVIYSACSSYLHYVNENRLKKELFNPNARLLLTAVTQDGETTCRLCSFFWGMLANACSAMLLTPQLSMVLPLTPLWNALVGCGIVLLLGTPLILLLTLVIPNKITAHYATRYSFKRAGFIRFFWLLGLPLHGFLRLLSNIPMRILGLEPQLMEDSVTQDMLMLTLDKGEEKGVIEETEKDMIENILEFNDTVVSEIMTHRRELCAAEDTLPIAQALQLAVNAGRSRIPVYHQDIDSVRGILYVKDLLPYIGKPIPPTLTLADIVRPAYFIPATKKCSQLFNELTEKKIHIAVIVDEYGGTRGLVTIEDLIESIVGNIQDEYDNEEEDIQRLSESEFTVDGSTSIDEICDLTNTALPEGDYDTIAGFVTEQLGRILKQDERPVLLVQGLEITVLAVEDQRISKLKIHKLPPAPKPEKESGKRSVAPPEESDDSPLLEA